MFVEVHLSIADFLSRPSFFWLLIPFCLDREDYFRLYTSTRIAHLPPFHRHTTFVSIALAIRASETFHNLKTSPIWTRPKAQDVVLELKQRSYRASSLLIILILGKQH